jgi:hypothetical protein
MSADRRPGARLSAILFTLILIASFTSASFRLPLQPAGEAWVQYQDPYWEFRVSYPAAWRLQPVPYRDFGFRISSPDSRVDPSGRLIEGAYFGAQVTAISPEGFAAYRSARLADAGIKQHTFLEVSGKPMEEVTSEEADGSSVIERWIFENGFLYAFQIAVAPRTSQADQAIAGMILSSFNPTGAPPRDYPYIPSGGLPASLQFQFPALLHAFQAGTGRVLFDYDLPTHTGGDDFAFDLCEGGGCVQGNTSQYILAPTDLTLVYSGPGYGMPPDSQDYHIFEVADDGTQKLCLSLGHFQIMLPGLTIGKRVSQHAAIGQLSAYTSIPHIHMGMWLSPAGDGCDGYSRLALPFSGAYKLDGVDYPAGKSYAGLSVTSHNSPVCATPVVNSPGSLGSTQALISPGDCFPPCPQSGGVILYKNAVYACNAEGAEAGYVLRNYEARENTPAAFNDAASSVFVPAGWSVRLFEGAEFSGGALCVNAPGLNTFQGVTFDNGIPLDNRVSSFEVSAAANCPGQPATNIVVESSSSHVIRGGLPFSPIVRVHPVGGSLDPSRGDSLVNIDGEPMGASPRQGVKSHVRDGEIYTFQSSSHPGFSMVAPVGDGTYASRWQMLVNGAWLGPVITIPILVDNTPPTVTLISPGGPYLTTNPILLQADVKDASSGVDQAQFLVGYDNGQGWAWFTLGWDSDGSDGWKWQWDASTVPDQPGIAFYIYAWDRAGNGQGTASWDYILDRNPPKTTVYPLPAVLATTAIDLRWDSVDAGSGVRKIDIQMQQGGGLWQDWLTGFDGSLNHAQYVGVMGQSYAFRLRGTDWAGFAEAYPATPQATTTISDCTGDAQEPDDELASAVELTPGAGVFTSHNFCGVGDQDWVRFWGHAGFAYMIETLNLGPTANTRLSLYAPDGTLLAEDDDVVQGVEVRSRIRWLSQADGWLYVKAWSANPAICGSAVSYDLRVYPGYRMYMPVFFP